jgi:chemotaxis protein MotB
MALSRRGAGRFSAQIWPGFVDAMTALILVLFFVLSIFMIVQFVLRDTITGQGRQLEELSVQVANLADALGLERSRADTQEALVSTLTGEKAAAEAEVAALTGEKEAAEARIADFEAQVASLIARNTDLSGRLTAAEAESAERLSASQALEAALAQARGELDAGAEAARLAAARREALEALVASLRSDVEGLEARTADQEAEIEAAATLTADQAAKLAAALALTEEQAGKLAAAEKLTAEQRAALEAAGREAAARVKALDDAEAARLVEAAAAQALRERLKDADAELTTMTLSLEAERKKAEETLTLLAAAEAAKKQLEGERTAALTEAERRAAELAQARALLAGEKEVSAEGQRQVALLNQQTASLRTQLDELQGLLDASEAKDVAAQVQIESLGQNLNAALARVAIEERRRAELEAAERERLAAEAQDLTRYRSEFFGKMREILGSREGVEVVGDRFVFPSEVLFAPGSATLGAAGQAQVARVADVIREIADEIPPGIDWVLRVDGHTDKTPVSADSQFSDNWELSQARALSVVRYMTQVQGLPPERLAATGFGEHQPIDPGDSPEALARNRRIELKFTER